VNTTPGVNVFNTLLFSFPLTLWHNKLKCFAAGKCHQPKWFFLPSYFFLFSSLSLSLSIYIYIYIYIYISLFLVQSFPISLSFYSPFFLFPLFLCSSLSSPLSFYFTLLPLSLFPLSSSFPFFLFPSIAVSLSSYISFFLISFLSTFFLYLACSNTNHRPWLGPNESTIFVQEMFRPKLLFFFSRISFSVRAYLTSSVETLLARHLRPLKSHLVSRLSTFF
jgi:hypothetical protein